MDKQQLEEGLELAVQYEKRGGLVPIVVQDFESREVLALVYANRQALHETLDSGYATFWNTSEDRLWKKGETSGDLLKIIDVRVDCDQDALVYMVEIVGSGACHTKDKSGKTRASCFYRRIGPQGGLEFI